MNQTDGPNFNRLFETGVKNYPSLYFTIYLYPSFSRYVTKNKLRFDSLNEKKKNWEKLGLNDITQKFLGIVVSGV